jgi:hypothetical protein
LFGQSGALKGHAAGGEFKVRTKTFGNHAIGKDGKFIIEKEIQRCKKQDDEALAQEEYSKWAGKRFYFMR